MQYNTDPEAGGIKHDENKPRMELLPAEALVAVADVFTYGAKKYAPFQWRRGPGMAWMRLYGAAQRHLNAWQAGEDQDPESSLSHVSHALANLLMLQSHMVKGQGIDDRPETLLDWRPTAPDKVNHSLPEPLVWLKSYESSGLVEHYFDVKAPGRANAGELVLCSPFGDEAPYGIWRREAVDAWNAGCDIERRLRIRGLVGRESTDEGPVLADVLAKVYRESPKDHDSWRPKGAVVRAHFAAWGAVDMLLCLPYTQRLSASTLIGTALEE